MKACSQPAFDAHLQALQNDPESRLTGPFIHSAPHGNMFRGPFREKAWMIGMETVLMTTWTPETGWHHYRASDGDA